jgi:hypothetical protein
LVQHVKKLDHAKLPNRQQLTVGHHLALALRSSIGVNADSLNEGYFMIKLMRFIAAIAIVLSTLSGLASAQNRTNTSTTSANLHIQVNVVQVVMTEKNPKATPETAVSYSIPTIQPRMSVTKETRKMQATDGKSPMVEITTIVAE